MAKKGEKIIDLGIPNFDIFNKLLKAAVERLPSPECTMWKSLSLHYLKDIGGELIFNCNFSPKTLPHLSRLLLFYKDMLNAWQKILSHTPLSKNEVENEIIWKNKFVTVERKSVFY